MAIYRGHVVHHSKDRVNPRNFDCLNNIYLSSRYAGCDTAANGVLCCADAST